MLVQGGVGTNGIVSHGSIEIAPGGRLTATGGVAGMQITGKDAGVITNDGILEIQGDAIGLRRVTASSTGNLALKGSGVTRVTSLGKVNLGDNYEASLAGFGCGIWSDYGKNKERDGIQLQGGQIEIAGPKGSVMTDSLEIDPGVTGTLMGEIKCENVENNSGGGMQYIESITPLQGRLDLFRQTGPACFYSNTGTVQWIPAAGDAPARLALTAMKQSTVDGNFYLSDALTLPANTAVDVTMSANTAIENGDGPAVAAPGGTLTFYTPYLGEDYRPNVRGITAPGGSVAFTGGDFDVYGGADAPITVRGDVGSVELRGTEGPDGVQPATAETVTVDATGSMGRAGYHAELTTREGENGEIVHLPGSPSNSVITYQGNAEYLKAAISEGVLPSFKVTYKANYTGPADVPDGEYPVGADVTVLQNPFHAPSGKTFAGWAETADGAVKYKAGATFQMPDASVVLYAVWKSRGGGGGIPTYTVTYKANYTGGPADVRDAGYRAGADVTAKQSDTFAAPAGQSFASWAESATGEVKYKAGETSPCPLRP